MIVRHIIFAGLFATASFANAGTVDASAASVQPAFAFATATSAAPVMAFQSSLAGPGGSWSAQSRMGDIGSTSMMLFSQSGSGFSAAPVAAASATAPAQAAAAPVAFTETAKAAPEASIAAPAATDMPAIVLGADGIDSANAPAALAAVPEPATGMLMLAGLLGAGFMTRRRNK
ncbi:PEP-CTERM sorting domain-containing protein [Massilia sp. TWP1-3-3]|uniref:PEP-CTERM sorting domain-containing protein n=1 Tax=Massilia sp. TWP1-3-3 TaxID=2804573 RepID=UPI003CF1CE45